MAVFPNSQVEKSAVAEPEQTMQSDTTVTVTGLAKYRHTILFAITALLIIAIATAVAATRLNSVVAGLAESQLIEFAEESTTNDARHIQSMVSGGMVMPGMGQGAVVIDSSDSMSLDQDQSTAMQSGADALGENVPLSLDMLIAPTGLPAHFDDLVAGLGVVGSRLFSPAGEMLWSTGSYPIDQPRPTDFQLKEAFAGTISSLLVKNREFVDRDGTVHTIDIVETYVPLRDSPTSPVVGVLEINRRVGTDLGRLLADTKSTVVWTTVATMTGLFLALAGFVVISDRMIHQSNQRQLELAAGRRLAERHRADEEAERARALESSNRELDSMTAQLVETQDQLVRSEKLAAIGQWSGGVAHDLRNPLGAIKNANYMLKRRLTSDGAIDANPKIEKYIDIIDLQIVRSNKIITDLMTFVNIGAFTLTETHLDQVLAETLETMVNNENVELSRHMDPDLFPVMADGEQLQRVFLNLANNAQEAMPNGGHLTITAKNAEDHVEIIFTDTGEGISDENIGKIFDPLFTRKTKGTGLGLAVCHEIILRHGGTISVRQNEEPSGGTIFEVKIPSVVQQPQAQGETAHDA